MGRIGFSCLFPASWHFSLSSQVLPRLLTPSFRQLLFIGLVLCLIGLLYLLLVAVNTHTSWTGEENPFHRHLARVTDLDATDRSNPNLNYGLVVDCGSSGSRVFVYCWPRHNGNPRELLDIRQMRDQHRKPVVMKIKPGIAELAKTPEKASDYIDPLLSFAAQHIPKHKHQETPLYILCTAGMRILPESQQEAILEDLRTDIPVHFNFLFSDSHVEVISGSAALVFFSFRDIPQESLKGAHSHWRHSFSFVNNHYLFPACFFIVLLSIILYLLRLRRIHRRVAQRYTPSSVPWLEEGLASPSLPINL